MPSPAIKIPQGRRMNAKSPARGWASISWAEQYFRQPLHTVLAVTPVGACDNYNARHWMPAMGPAGLISACLERADYVRNRRDPRAAPVYLPSLDCLADHCFQPA